MIVTVSEAELNPKVLTDPEVVPIVASVVFVLLHVPPLVPSPKENVVPAHTDMEPVIAEGAVTTVTGKVTLQPDDNA